MVNLALGLAALQDEGGSEGVGVVGGLLGTGFVLFMLAFSVLMIVSVWKVFVKAGKPGWASLIPIYNIIVVLEVTGKPIWWVILFCIPFVNFIAVILVMIPLAEKFGKGAGFGIGLALLSFVFFPLLAFGDAEYRA